MEAPERLIKATATRAKQASLLWMQGFREACCLHRVVILCLRSRQLLIRTGQCFLLNGFIFLGSMCFLNSVVIPTLRWILPDQLLQGGPPQFSSFHGILAFYSHLRAGLVQLFYVCWFYPLYVCSFVLSNIWYNDIAKHGFAAKERAEPSLMHFSKQNDGVTSDHKVAAERSTGLGGVMIGIGEQVYSILLLTFFFLQVSATGFIPYVGKALNFLLLSWMYAYYCFEYKWNFSEVGIDKRLDFFESNWAFFSGFGSPCVLAILFFSPLVGYGVMATLFPLFVLTAIGSEAEPVISAQMTKYAGAALGKLPVFYVADALLRLYIQKPAHKLIDHQNNGLRDLVYNLAALRAGLKSTKGALVLQDKYVKGVTCVMLLEAVHIVNIA